MRASIAIRATAHAKTCGRLILVVFATLATTRAVESAQLAGPPPPPQQSKPAPPAEPQEPTEPPATVQLPIELVASRPIVRIKVNGQGPFAFLIDPLASQVRIDATLVESLELKTLPGFAGRIEAHLDLAFGDHVSKGVAAEVVSLDRLLPELGPAGQPRGVLGASLWKDQLVTIDLGRHRLHVRPGALPVTNNTDVFALQSTGDLVVPLALQTRSLQCRVDLMAPQGLLLPANSLLDLPIDKRSLLSTEIRTRQAVIKGQEARVKTVKIAAFVFEQRIVEFANVGELAVMGSRWLSDFALTYDLTNGRVGFARTRKS